MTIKVAIVGIGNCASALMQGISYYANHTHDTKGLITANIAGYRAGDIEVVAAFDVIEGKVGRSVYEAAAAPPNDTLLFAPVGNHDVTVLRGLTLDGLGKFIRGTVVESNALAVDVVQELRRSGAELVINYLPVGSERAARYYAASAIEAHCGFINCMPTFIASDFDYAASFRTEGVPIVGDDIKSQVGATIVHRALATLMRERGVELLRTSQLNVGGNSDFYNMLERDRLISKKISKTEAVTSVMGVELPAEAVHIGPSDHVPWLTDRKWAYIRLEGRAFGGAPLNIELKLEVWDSPNSAAVVIDAIRCARVALDRGIGGPIDPACAWYMKHPPQQCDDEDAKRALDAWLAQ